MKIYIFGSNGMLGCYLRKYLTIDHQVVPLTRDNFDLRKSMFLDYLNFFKNNHLNQDDVIINAAGIIKQKKFDIKDLVLVNSCFPHVLADIKSVLGCNIIHVTTDCVFSGTKGNYKETDHHDCFDEYGKSKSLGENSTLTCIRTSIIGEENHNKKSLLEWV
jgi:dTDP-4-dehydrorhamnose reductase